MAKKGSAKRLGRGAGEHTVGYGRPPKEHRFKKGGPCPNPYGRGGKPSHCAVTDKPDFLEEKIPIRQDGRVVYRTRDEIIDHQLFAKAAQGDVHASRRLDERQVARKAEARRAAATAPKTDADDQADEDIIERALARRRARDGGDVPDPGDVDDRPGSDRGVQDTRPLPDGVDDE